MRPLVVGLGAHGREDDAVGICVASQLAALGLCEVDVVEHADPVDLFDMIGDRDVVVVVDAIVSGAVPGTVSVLTEVPAGARAGVASTHGMGLSEVLQLAAVLGRLPGTLHFVGVEAARTGHGDDLSGDVRSAVPVAVGEVRRLLRVGTDR